QDSKSSSPRMRVRAGAKSDNASCNLSRWRSPGSNSGGNEMSRSRKSLMRCIAGALAAGSMLAASAVSAQDGAVKIGVLTDVSGQFSHESGEGAITAVQMAVEDFGGAVLGKPTAVISGDHQNK